MHFKAQFGCLGKEIKKEKTQLLESKKKEEKKKS